MKLILLAALVTVSALGAEISVTSESSQFISEVILVKYARASDVAATLIRMITNSANGATAASSPTAALSTGTPANPAGNTTSKAGNDFSQGIQNLIRKAAASGDAQELGQPPIIADERTNSLLI